MIETPLKTIHDILFPYQTEDVERLLTIPRGIIGSEMGTGKTETFLAICDRLGAEHVLVVAPKTMVLEWQNRISLRLGEESGIPLGFAEGKHYRFSLTKEMFYNRFVIVSYPMLRDEGYVKILGMIPWDVMGYDEAHRLKNPRMRHPGSRRSRKGPSGSLQVWGARNLAKHTERLYHISGRIFLNYADELWSPLHMLYPDEFVDYEDFVDEYCIRVSTPFGLKVVANNKKTLPKLRERLSQLMIRRLKKDVLKDLPPKLYRDIPVAMDEQQATAYRSMEEEYVVMLKNGTSLRARNALAVNTRLQQLALEPALLQVDAPSAITAALLEFLEDSDEKKIVVFSWYEEYISYIEHLMKRPYVRITGKETPNQRTSNRIRFETDDSTEICLATIGAGGEGIDLVSSKVEVFTDLFWTNGMNEQAEDRLHRRGSITQGTNDNVLVVRFYIPNTVHDDKRRVLARKDVVWTEVMAQEAATELMMQRWN